MIQPFPLAPCPLGLVLINGDSTTICRFDIPSMTCKKSKPDCKDMNSAKHCEKLGSCKWVPFGPPGSKNGPGMCAFDMGACKFKPEEEEEFSF
mmetsp:Transcript_14019/g.21820  ORF Transcript_14019/g.21820 Transcript_14019/m.21820 type:complete len:93 (+) Transcript_14019:586-864(+)